MSRHSEIEDDVVAALDPLRQQNGGPLRSLLTFSKPSFEDALEEVLRAPPPTCLVISRGMSPSPLRTAKHHDQSFDVTLLLAARSLRSEAQARRGADGVYELLDATHDVLVGHQIAGAFDVLEPGRERLLAASKNTVIWSQDWSVVKYV